MFIVFRFSANIEKKIFVPPFSIAMYEADSGGRHTSTSFIHFSATFSFVLYEEMKRDRKKERGREIEGKREQSWQMHTIITIITPAY